MRRFQFSSSDHLNTNISDEQGNTLYSVSTPSALGSKKVTTIKKYDPALQGGDGEVMGIIEWPRLLDKGLFRFDGKVIPVDEMFQKRKWSNGLFFVGPDRRTYKWKLSPRCWMKPAESDLELVRFHKKNLGIRKPLHSAYLEVSLNVVSMLDHIILTFVYAESRAEELHRERSAASRNMNAITQMNTINAINATNATNMTIGMC